LLIQAKINPPGLIEMFDTCNFDEYSKGQEGNFHPLEQAAIEAINELHNPSVSVIPAQLDAP